VITYKRLKISLVIFLSLVVCLMVLLFVRPSIPFFNNKNKIANAKGENNVITDNMMLYEDGLSREEYYKKTVEQYVKFDYFDPQTTKDEELFGVWDGNRWQVEPLLDYSRTVGLQKVEEAAKRGDYEECKKFILEYYRAKLNTYEKPGWKSMNTNKYRLCAEMLYDNFNVRPSYGPYPMKIKIPGQTSRQVPTLL
jgi:hypothetical protein